MPTKSKHATIIISMVGHQGVWSAFWNAEVAHNDEDENDDDTMLVVAGVIQLETGSM